MSGGYAGGIVSFCCSMLDAFRGVSLGHNIGAKIILIPSSHHILAPRCHFLHSVRQGLLFAVAIEQGTIRLDFQRM